MKVSVIVPVYNVYEYLDKCLNSLVNQTLNDIEIIVVNDGSPDKSQDIIDKYKKKYQNIKAYKKNNGGLSDARNFGIKKASGEYIAFVDSDDYVSLDMYEKMYIKAKTNNYDMVVCDTNLIDENYHVIKRVSSNIIEDTNNIKDVMIKIYPAAWNKIYKRELFDNGLVFKKGVWFEDVEFMYRLLPTVKNIGVVHEAMYQYLQRKGSITSSVDKRIYNYIDNFNGLIDYYKENNYYVEYYEELEYNYVRYLYATFIKTACKYDHDEFLVAYNTARENQKKNYPDYYKNKYFYKSLKGIYLLLFNKFLANLVYLKNHKR